jgi:hypothetical protein
MVAWPCGFGPVTVQDIIVGACGRGSCSSRSSQEVKKRSRKEPESQESIQRHTLNDLTSFH